MKTRIKIGLLGATGRMGKTIASLCRSSKKFQIIYSISKSKDLRDKEIPKIDVLIDFSLPEGTIEYLPLLVKEKIPMVSGTTGFKHSQFALLKQAAQKISIVYSPNMSIGMNILFYLSQRLAQVVPADFDFSLVEIHHARKKDKPSGSALRILQILEQGGRKGIPVRSIRTGDVVGDHELTIRGQGESLTIQHQAQNRSCFAEGALLAAEWMVTHRPRPGLYSMWNVLGIFNNKS